MKILTATTLVVLSAAPLGAGGPGTPFRFSLVDASGVAYSGIEVSLVGLDTGRAVTVRSDQSGAVEAALDVGDYAIDLTRSGFAIDSGQRVIKVQSGQQTYGVFRLKRTESEPGTNLLATSANFGQDDHSSWWRRRPQGCQPYRGPGNDDDDDQDEGDYFQENGNRFGTSHHRRHPRPHPRLCAVSASR